VGMWPITQHS